MAILICIGGRFGEVGKEMDLNKKQLEAFRRSGLTAAKAATVMRKLIKGSSTSTKAMKDLGVQLQKVKKDKSLCSFADLMKPIADKIRADLVKEEDVSS